MTNYSDYSEEENWDARTFQAIERLLELVEKNEPLPKPKTSFSFDRFEGKLLSIGIKFKKDGEKVKIIKDKYW